MIVEIDSEIGDGKVESWTIHRQDDNGNRFIVETGLSHADAERLVALYEARGHKQIYWAERDDEK